MHLYNLSMQGTQSGTQLANFVALLAICYRIVLL